MVAETEQYDLNYTLWPGESALACLLLYARPRRLLIRAALMLAVITATIAVLTLARNGLDALSPDFLFSLLPYMGFAVVLSLLVPAILATISALTILLTRDRKRWDFHVVVSVENIRGSSRLLDTQYRWVGFKRLFVVGDRAYANMQSGQSILLPRRGLANDADWPGLLEFVRARIGRDV